MMSNTAQTANWPHSMKVYYSVRWAVYIRAHFNERTLISSINLQLHNNVHWNWRNGRNWWVSPYWNRQQAVQYIQRRLRVEKTYPDQTTAESGRVTAPRHPTIPTATPSRRYRSSTQLTRHETSRTIGISDGYQRLHTRWFYPIANGHAGVNAVATVISTVDLPLRLSIKKPFSGLLRPSRPACLLRWSLEPSHFDDNFFKPVVKCCGLVP